MKDSTILLLALVGVGGFFLYKGGQKAIGAVEGMVGAIGGIPQGIIGGFTGAVSAPFEAAGGLIGGFTGAVSAPFEAAGGVFGGLLGGLQDFFYPAQPTQPAPKTYIAERAAYEAQLTQQSSLKNVASLQNILSTMRVNTPAYSFLAGAIPAPQIRGTSLPIGTQVIAGRGAYQIIEPSGKAYSVAAPKSAAPLKINVMNPFGRF